jgi:hypothetical protein
MLVQGTLLRAIDWFDLLMHGRPWVLIVLKSWRMLRRLAELIFKIQHLLLSQQGSALFNPILRCLNESED